jgi:hypothetical protein
MCGGKRHGAANPGGHDFLERVSGSIDAQRHLKVVELAGRLGHAVAAGLLLDPAQVGVDGVEADRAGLRIVAGSRTAISIPLSRLALPVSLMSHREQIARHHQIW